MNTRIPLEMKALGLSVFVAGMTLSSVFAAARVLRHEAMRDSHQQPTEEDWLELPTPTTPALVARGRILFLRSCAHCHGADARGDEGPDLHDVHVSDRYIAHIIIRGIKGEMPSFAKKHDANDVAALTSYMRSLK